MGVELGTKREQQGLVARESHPMRFPRMPPNLRNQALFIVGTGHEPTIALEHLFHDSSPRP